MRLLLVLLVACCCVAAQAQSVSIVDTGRMQVHHIALSVSNIDSAVQWYVTKLNFQAGLRRELGEIRQAVLEKGAARIELFQMKASMPARSKLTVFTDDLKLQGYKHVALTITGLDAFFAGLEKKGVRILVRPTFDKDLNLTIGFIEDMDGNLIEFVELPRKN